MTDMEGIHPQYPTGYVCDVCGGIAVIDVDDGDHYLCAADAIEPMMDIDLTRDEPIVAVAATPAPTSRVMMMRARTAAPSRPLLGVTGTALVDGARVPDRFDHLIHAGMPHHVTLFEGQHLGALRRLARLLGVKWVDG